jgi:GTP-binding protein
VKSRTFVDTVVAHVYAGRGGNGSASFRREKFIPKGGPDGGDGGRGGHVTLLVDPDMSSLVAIYYSPHLRAGHAGAGGGQQKHGRNGKDLVVKVPRGTEVRVRESGEFLGDLVEVGEELRIATGGAGGKGNVHWKTSTHQTPIERTEGKAGDVCELRLTLKIVADVGLVGFPNAGKSSLLTAISDAHPKIGAYQFTTLNPIIGTLIYEDYSRLTVADIPGLIKGAHEGIGLGHAFLRHIERARYLVFIIDMAACDGRSPAKDYADLKEELRLYNLELQDRPALVVANKMDLPEAEENLEEFKKATGLDPLLISALEETGLEALRTAIRDVAHID